MEKRKQREKEFHNKALGEHTRARLSRFYKLSKKSNAFYESCILPLCNGKRVLEYGCGPESYSFVLASHGTSVTGIDISEVAIAQATEEARKRGLGDNLEFVVMDAEDLSGLEDCSFDLVCGRSIIHHLDIDKSFSELSRVLKPDGVAIFLEPLGHNPLISIFRKVTPSLRTVDEHPLFRKDLRIFSEYFKEINVTHFDCFTLVAVPFSNTFVFPYLVKGLRVLDRLIFRLIPLVRWLSWVAVFELSGPMKRGR